MTVLLNGVTFEKTSYIVRTGCYLLTILIFESLSVIFKKDRLKVLICSLTIVSSSVNRVDMSRWEWTEQVAHRTVQRKIFTLQWPLKKSPMVVRVAHDWIIFIT